MKTYVFGTLALVLLTSASIVSAQSFTYVSTSNAPTTTVGGAGPDGRLCQTHRRHLRFGQGPDANRFRPLEPLMI